MTLTQQINNIRHSVISLRPLVHCITNPISINLCANAALAIGTRPIMAEHPDEVLEITATANALMLNLGNITDARMKSMCISAEQAAKLKIPFVLDLVGVSCSSLRRSFAKELIKDKTPTVIKGNYSEIRAFFDESYSSAGVDAEDSLEIRSISKIASSLAKQLNCIVIASGAVDIITDGKSLFHIKNGCSELSTTTGTGCLLGLLCTCYLTADKSIASAISACAVLGICGELSRTKLGSGSFLVNLMDNLNTLSNKHIEKKLKLEETDIEKL